MQVLKAYANTEATDRHNLNTMQGNKPDDERREHKAPKKPSGDTLTLSDEARELLETKPESVSVCAQDATYDQYGNVTRQIDNVQSDLRKLASHFMNATDGAGMTSRINSLRSQLASIQATV